MILPEKSVIPRILIAATRSGEGKTSVSLGINRALCRRGLVVQPWKAGPDYLDPGYHTLAAGRICRNLDTWMLSPEVNRALFRSSSMDADIALVEGVMGFYDGSVDGSGKGSSADLADILSLPVILVLDAGGMAQSAGAIAAGFVHFVEKAGIAGFILNRVAGDRHAFIVKSAVENATGLPIFGVLPKRAELVLPERHLGLLSARSNPGLDETLETLADAVEENVDLDAVLAAAREAKPLSITDNSAIFPQSLPEAGRPVIAYALDDAFHFYYQDNLDFLTHAGGDLLSFSPLADSSLPDCDALYIGGGYPELHAERLSGNREMINSIRSAVTDGVPVFAECGGYMYLAQAILDGNGRRYPMAGVLEGEVRMGEKLRRLGYCEIRTRSDGPLGPRDISARGHLFHYSRMDNTENAEIAYSLRKTGSNERVPEGQVKGAVCAGYTHVHLASNPHLAENFVSAAAAYRTRRNPGGSTVSQA